MCSTQEPVGVWGVERLYSSSLNRRGPSRHRLSRPGGAVPGAPVTAKPISGDPVKWWSVERKSEEGVVAVIDVDNTTRRSEGPPARCAWLTGEGLRDCRERLFALVRLSENRVRALGSVVNAGGFVECDWSTAWGKAG